MERMNEILARAANRRISTRRAPTPAPSRTSAAAASATAPAATRHAAPRRATPGQATTGPGGGPPPLRPLASADAASQSERPAADVLDADRILELPPRSSARIVRPSGASGASGVTAGEMTSIHELAPRYAAQLGPRRTSRAAPPTEPATSSAPDAPIASRGTPASRGASAASKSAQSARTSRATGKASTPGVCPLCHGAGYVRLDVPVGDPAFGQAIRCTCKEQQIEERDRSNLRRLSNLDPFRDRTFESFDSKQPGVQEAYTIARRYAKDPLGWLVFRGSYGCGKTHLAAAIANVAEQNGVPVIFAIVPELLDHLRATFAPNSETPYDALFDKVREVQLLVLDDFGAENGTAWATEKLFQLINYRYNYGMPTVITTNDRLLSRVDERIRSRLFDQDLVRHILIEAKDYRKHRKPSVKRNP